MFKYAAHLHTLNRKMYMINHLPTLFEYYSARHLTRMYNKPFFVYNDLDVSQKAKFGFPLCDKGVDIVDEDFTHIAQVKYYKEDRHIGYGKLSTFLATPLLVGRGDLVLTLLRTSHSKLDRDIQNIIERGYMNDVSLCDKEFLQYIHFYN